MTEINCSYRYCDNIFEFKSNKKYCSTNCKQKARQVRNSYRIHKGNNCIRCGFVPEHPVQLDVDHIDGNNKNNDISNLQTLCANCHRLKTFKNKDWLS
jgi:5-methylcytosine-specific restriction endonuclease McrA